MASKKDRRDAAQLARQVLTAVEQGELEADSPAARRLLRRLEGAAAAWEAELDPQVAVIPSEDRSR